MEGQKTSVWNKISINVYKGENGLLKIHIFGKNVTRHQLQSMFMRGMSWLDFSVLGSKTRFDWLVPRLFPWAVIQCQCADQSGSGSFMPISSRGYPALPTAVNGTQAKRDQKSQQPNHGEDHQFNTDTVPPRVQGQTIWRILIREVVAAFGILHCGVMIAGKVPDKTYPERRGNRSPLAGDGTRREPDREDRGMDGRPECQAADAPGGEPDGKPQTTESQYEVTNNNKREGVHAAFKGQYNASVTYVGLK
jgi:hypothetical protein